MKIKTKYEFSKKTSGDYVNNWQHNLMFLLSQQNWANDKCRVKGVVFLNDILEALDLELVSYGYKYGWVYDDAISFGLELCNIEKGTDIPYKDGKAIWIRLDGVRNIEKEWLKAYNLRRVQ